MNYKSQHDQLKHSSLLGAIRMQKREIAQRYRMIEKLQERLAKIGTEEEQKIKRTYLDNFEIRP